MSAPTKDLTEMNQQELKEHNRRIEVEIGMIKKGYNHIKEKIRAIRKAYNKSVTKGTRSVATLILLCYKLWELPFTCFMYCDIL